jgi:hypothetical protein
MDQTALPVYETAEDLLAAETALATAAELVEKSQFAN